MGKAKVTSTTPKMVQLEGGKHMHGVPVVNQKISLGAMEHMRIVNLLRIFLKQKSQKMVLYVCASKQKILPIVMVHI